MENIIKYTFNIFCPVEINPFLTIYNDEIKNWDENNNVEFIKLKKYLYVKTLNLSLNKSYQYKYLLKNNNLNIIKSSPHCISKEELQQLRNYSNIHKENNNNINIYIMSFNLRYLNKKDYSNHLNWHNRKHLCVKVIQNYFPDFYRFSRSKTKSNFIFTSKFIYICIYRTFQIN